VKKVWVYTIGGVVQPGMDLVEVVPSNETLVVEAELPVSDVGLVRLNQKSKVRLAGAMGVEYDALTGVVDHISPDTMKNKEGEEFYQVKILLENDRFVGGAGSFALRPGLSVDCSLIIFNRSLLENLLAPFISAKTKAFSENVWTSSVEQEKWSIRFVDLLKASFMN
jgi:adhesin transport system membrane fusion protein